MSSETIGEMGLAGRYATALFELAEEQKALDAVASDLTSLKAMLGESPDLVRLVRSPVIAREDQAKALDAVLKKGKANDLTRRFVGVLAQNRRLYALAQVINAFLAQLAARRGEVSAEVIAARPLSAAQMTAMNDSLKRAIGSPVAVDVKIDPTLLGGMVVRVGSRMIDSSLRTKLNRLQLAMKGVG